jgi:hypothetical protein
MTKIADRELLRSTILNILLQMGEIEQTQADNLAANPDTNFDLVRVNFDSLTVIDFCLRIETSTGIVIDPGEMVEFAALNELEAALMAKSPS